MSKGKKCLGQAKYYVKMRIEYTWWMNYNNLVGIKTNITSDKIMRQTWTASGQLETCSAIHIPRIETLLIEKKTSQTKKTRVNSGR